MKADNRIILDYACPKKWDVMTPTKNGRHCDSCNKVVIDFSKKSLSEINDKIGGSSEEQTCGRVRTHHIIQDNRWFSFLNRFEQSLAKVRMRWMALAVISVLLFITGCHRHQGGYVSRGNNKYNQYTEIDSTAMAESDRR